MRMRVLCDAGNGTQGACVLDRHCIAEPRPQLFLFVGAEYGFFKKVHSVSSAVLEGKQRENVPPDEALERAVPFYQMLKEGLSSMTAFE